MHTFAVSMAKIRKLNFELLQHPPYSTDLAASDFFPNLRFASNKRVIAQHILILKICQILLFRRLKEVGETLGKVYRVKRWFIPQHQFYLTKTVHLELRSEISLKKTGYFTKLKLENRLWPFQLQCI